MSILVFPSILVASGAFARETARRSGERLVGASSVDVDPNAHLFDAWRRLPFIGEEAFLPALGELIAQEEVTAIYTPHSQTFHVLQRDLPARFPGVELLGAHPHQRQMGAVRAALDDAQAAQAKIAEYADRSASPYPVHFTAGLLQQVETFYGQSSREKILAVCGVAAAAPEGDVVEIGTLFGKSAYVLNRVAAFHRLGTTLCIDPWRVDLALQHDAPDYVREVSSSWDWDVVHAGFLVGMLASSAGDFNYLRATSAAARRIYGPGETITSPEFGSTRLSGSISILHLDGNHDEAAVADDFEAWGPRVAPGGWIVFDDYHWPHGDGPRNVADRALAEYGPRVCRRFVAGGAMFINLAP